MKTPEQCVRSLQTLQQKYKFLVYFAQVSCIIQDILFCVTILYFEKNACWENAEDTGLYSILANANWKLRNCLQNSVIILNDFKRID